MTIHPNYDNIAEFLRSISAGIDSYIDTEQEAQQQTVLCAGCVVGEFMDDNTTALTADILSLSKGDVRGFVTSMYDFHLRMSAMYLLSSQLLELTADVLEPEIKEDMARMKEEQV